MIPLHETINNLNESARKVYGPDINVSVARAPAFGNDDICFIVHGLRQSEVALDLLRFVHRGEISQTSSEFMGHESISTIVVGAPR